MISKHIQTTLSALKEESKQIKFSDTDSLETLNQIIDKLEQQLSEPEVVDHRSLIEHLELSVSKLEVSHPTITSIANDLMLKLAGMGI